MTTQTQTKKEKPKTKQTAKMLREVRYSFAPGSRLPSDKAPAVAHRLERVRAKQGKLDVEIALEDASNPHSPLHEFCEWNDAKAGHEYRLIQMGHLMRSIRVEYVENGNTIGPHRYLVNIDVSSETDDDSRYVPYWPIEMALSDEILRNALIAECLAAIERFKAKYAEILQLAEIRDKLKTLLP